MKIIGITGPSGSGKTAIGDILGKMGIYTADADKIYHSLLTPPSLCLDELSEEQNFGRSILLPDGSLNRKKLSSIVFSSEHKDKLELLNGITHKYVLVSMLAAIESCRARGDKAVAVDVPLLFESGFDKLCATDINISVIADRYRRISRIMARDAISREDAEKRVNAQPNDEFYISRSDYVIYNNEGEQELQEKLSEIINQNI